jgi:hypothetical protein
MMNRYTEERVRSEIDRVLDRQHDAGQELQPQWATHEVCGAHRRGLAALPDDAPPEELDHVAFWDFAGYTNTRRLATRCVNAREQPGPDQQPVLPGFEELFRYYVHTRGGVDVGVRIEDSTDEELLTKADLYEAQGNRQIKHADQLRRYVGWRRIERARAAAG